MYRVRVSDCYVVSYATRSGIQTEDLRKLMFDKWLETMRFKNGANC